MLNYAMIVGRIFKIGDNEGEYLDIEVSVKNSDDNCGYTFIPCRLSGSLKDNTLEYCKVDDIVGVRGKLKQVVNYTEDDKLKTKLMIIADKITFLSSNKDVIDKCNEIDEMAEEQSEDTEEEEF